MLLVALVWLLMGSQTAIATGSGSGDHTFWAWHPSYGLNPVHVTGDATSYTWWSDIVLIVGDHYNGGTVWNGNAYPQAGWAQLSPSITYHPSQPPDYTLTSFSPYPAWCNLTDWCTERRSTEWLGYFQEALPLYAYGVWDLYIQYPWMWVSSNTVLIPNSGMYLVQQ